MKRRNAFEISDQFLRKAFTNTSYQGEEVTLYGSDLVTLAQNYLGRKDDYKNKTSFQIEIATALKCQIDKYRKIYF